MLNLPGPLNRFMEKTLSRSVLGLLESLIVPSVGTVCLFWLRDTIPHSELYSTLLKESGESK